MECVGINWEAVILQAILLIKICSDIDLCDNTYVTSAQRICGVFTRSVSSVLERQYLQFVV